MTGSRFIRAAHPKTTIQPNREAVEKVLSRNWVAQEKIHGHRVQIHLPADRGQVPVAYNRHGKPHQKPLSAEIIEELYRVVVPQADWTVLDGEWIKSDDKVYLFDYLKKDGNPLRGLSFVERYQKLPRAYLSPHLQTLPLVTTVEDCLNILETDRGERSEGLVFRSPSKGFDDTSIIRCRRAGFVR